MKLYKIRIIRAINWLCITYLLYLIFKKNQPKSKIFIITVHE